MKYIVKKSLEIWRDEDLTAGRQELPVDTLIEETRRTQHKKVDALWLRYNANHVGYASRDRFWECAVEVGDPTREQARGHHTTVHFLKHTR